MAEAAEEVRLAAHPEANIIFGACVDDRMGDDVQVTVIATGFDPGVMREAISPPPAWVGLAGPGVRGDVPAADPADLAYMPTVPGESNTDEAADAAEVAGSAVADGPAAIPTDLPEAVDTPDVAEAPGTTDLPEAAGVADVADVPDAPQVVDPPEYAGTAPVPGVGGLWLADAVAEVPDEGGIADGAAVGEVLDAADVPDATEMVSVSDTPGSPDASEGVRHDRCRRPPPAPARADRSHPRTKGGGPAAAVLEAHSPRVESLERNDLVRSAYPRTPDEPTPAGLWRRVQCRRIKSRARGNWRVHAAPPPRGPHRIHPQRSSTSPCRHMIVNSRRRCSSSIGARRDASWRPLPAAGRSCRLSNRFVLPALERIGADWQDGRLSLAQVYMAGRVAEDLVSEVLPPAEVLGQGHPAIGIAVVEDHHALGKRLVLAALRASGWTVTDYGHGIGVDDLCRRVNRDQIEILLVSVLMLPSALRVRDLRTCLDATGPRTRISSSAARRFGSTPTCGARSAPTRLDPMPPRP